MVAQIASAVVIKFKQQTIYVPAYSQIYVGPKEKPIDLAVTLSIRNTNAGESMTVTVVDFYDSDGNPVKTFIKSPVTIKPFGTVKFVISESDNLGGSGANFLVKWHADKRINAPVVETVMIGTKSSLGISFTSRGVVIGE